MRGRVLGILMVLVVVLTPAFWDFGATSAQNDPILFPTRATTETPVAEIFRGIDLPSTPAPYEFQRQTGELPVLAEVDFEADTDAIFDLHGLMLLDYQPTTQSGRGLAVNSQYSFPMGYIEAVRLTADVHLNDGGVYLSVRGSGAGDYRLELTPALIRLYRGATLLDDAKFPLDSMSFKVSLAARGDKIIAKLNDETVLSYTDPEPLPYGVITFGALGASETASLLDNVRLEGVAAQDLTGGWARIESIMRQSPLRLEDVVTFPTDRRLYGRQGADLKELWAFNLNNLMDKQLILEMKTYPGVAENAQPNAIGPSVSPDGTKIAFHSLRDGAWNLWVKHREGILFKLTSDRTPVVSASHIPAWSPDNLNVAYNARKTIRIVNLITRIDTQAYPAFGESVDDICTFDWSPVANKLLVTTDENGQVCRKLIEITTSGQVINTLLTADPELQNSPAYFSPSYSSDGLQATIIQYGTSLNPSKLYRFEVPMEGNLITLNEIYSVSNSVTISQVIWLKLGDNQPDILAVAEKSGTSTYRVRLLNNTGTILSTLNNIYSPLSWSPGVAYHEAYEKCVSIEIGTTPVNVYPSAGNMTPIATYQAPSRLHLVGQMQTTNGQWLQFDGLFPTYAPSQTPAASGTKYWVRATEFPIDPCEDGATVNPYQGGYARDAYYLPVLGQPERTLTPVPTYTPIPACVGTVSASTSVNIRVGPGQGYSAVRQVENGDNLTVIGKVADNSWFKITSPDINPNWIHSSVLEINLSSYSCLSLPLYDFQGLAQATYTPSPTRIPSTTPTLGPSPTRVPRDVVPEARPLHDRAYEIGLPLPFDSWPVADYSAVTWKQGYGPTSFAWEAQPPPYKRTHQIHNGIDFYSPKENQAVISVCSGIVIGGRTTGNFTGYGVSIRCFLDDPLVINSEEGILSNIVVSYNHLQFNRPVNFPENNLFQIVNKGQIIGYTSSYYYGNGEVVDDYRLCHLSNNLTDGNPNDCRIFDEGMHCVDIEIIVLDECVLAGRSSDHLHLEIFIARGKNAHLNAIRLNPLLMFNQNIVTEFSDSQSDDYFPIEDVSILGEVFLFSPDFAISPYAINEITLQGNLPDRDPNRRGFFQIQDITLTGPEWWVADATDDPCVSVENCTAAPRLIANLNAFLWTYGYSSSTTGNYYIGPNCIFDSNLPNFCRLDYSDLHWEPLFPDTWPSNP